MVAMSRPTRPEHWEPPDPPKLLISARRVAKELDIPAWKAQQLCYCLGRIYYTEGVHYRVPWKSLLRFKFLMEELGMSFDQARTELCRENYERSDRWFAYDSPPEPRDPWGLTPRSRAYHARRGWHR